MKQWTEQEQPHQKRGANGNIKEKDSANSRNGNQAAEQHQPNMVVLFESQRRRSPQKGY
jgi:hypothetical protein